MSEKELLQAIYQDVRGLKSDVSELKSDVSELKSDVGELKNRMSAVELKIENETNRNIRIIAEGHLDLSRKFNEALKVEAEKEMLLIRMNIMESDIREMKKQISA